MSDDLICGKLGLVQDYGMNEKILCGWAGGCNDQRWAEVWPKELDCICSSSRWKTLFHRTCETASFLNGYFSNTVIMSFFFFCSVENYSNYVKRTVSFDNYCSLSKFDKL